jgi:hypothetical protein
MAGVALWVALFWLQSRFHGRQKSRLEWALAVAGCGMQTDESDEWQEWFRLTPLERWHETSKLWAQYLAQGGSLDPEPDSQSPFDFPELRGTRAVDGGAGLRVLRRGGV